MGGRLPGFLEVTVLNSYLTRGEKAVMISVDSISTNRWFLMLRCCFICCHVVVFEMGVLAGSSVLPMYAGVDTCSVPTHPCNSISKYYNMIVIILLFTLDNI